MMPRIIAALFGNRFTSYTPAARDTAKMVMR
jgi:hypothetical protein